MICFRLRDERVDEEDPFAIDDESMSILSVLISVDTSWRMSLSISFC